MSGALRTDVELSDIESRMAPRHRSKADSSDGWGLAPRPGLCGHDRGSVGLDRSSPAEDSSGDEGNKKADGQGLHECVRHVDKGVLVELLRALYGSDLRGGGGGVESGGLNLLYLRGEVAVHEMGHEVEVEDLPHRDVADGGDKGDQDAAGEGASEGDLAGEVIVPVAANAKVNQQERGHHHRVAENHAVAGADLVREQKRAAHQDGNDETGNQTESEYCLLHVRLLVRVTTESRCNETGLMSSSFRMILQEWYRKSCFRVTQSRQQA